MALFTVNEPSTWCNVHPDCNACPKHQVEGSLYTRDESCEHCKTSQAIGRACAEEAFFKEHTHVWSARFQWFNDQNPDGTPHMVTRNVYESYTGRVMRTGCHPNVRVMSDVWDNTPYAVVIQADGSPLEVSTYNGPGCSPYNDPGSYAEVDATPEALAEYVAWSEKQRLVFEAREAIEKPLREAREAKKLAENAERERKAPRKGRKVRVVASRGKSKVPKGTEGTCFWMGESGAFGTVRVGIKDAAGTVYWTAASNVEAI